MELPLIIEEHLDDLFILCNNFKVKKLYAFGSVLTSRFNFEKSDIDLIVELEPMTPLKKGETLLNFWNELEKLFQRKVDLLTDQPIKNQILKNRIEKTKQLIYDRRSKKISA